MTCMGNLSIVGFIIIARITDWLDDLSEIQFCCISLQHEFYYVHVVQCISEWS